MISPRKILSLTFFSYFLGTVLLVFSILFFSYHLAYARKIVPGVNQVGIDLGNKTESEAARLLESRLIELESANLEFVFEGARFSKSLAGWGVVLEATDSARKAYLVGRGGGVWETTRDKVRAWFRGIEIPSAVQINEEQFAAVFSGIAEELDISAEGARFEIEGAVLRITEAKEGREADKGRFRRELVSAVENLDFSIKVVPVETIWPDIVAADLEQVREESGGIVFSAPRFAYGTRSWILSPEEVLELLDFRSRSTESGRSPADSPELGSSGLSSGGVLELSPRGFRAELFSSAGSVEIIPSEAELNSFVTRLASEIDRPARGGTFNLESGRVIEFALPHEGYKLDEESTKGLVIETLLDPEENSTELPVAVTQVEANTNRYGIRELLGEGVSDFKGSIAGRIHNIDLASSRLDGILIAPGETFSFNQSLGDISKETGYQTSYIIKQGRTLLGVGGGVCQVSTTIFRAALYAGLPVLERTAHAYRVHYYEHPIGPGLDATVYEPSPNLVFKNDTAAHILIKRYFDAATNALRFSLYGTSDGRETEVIGPIIHSQTAPPEPVYIPDDSLPVGTTKQVDWAAWGAKVTVRRKVTRAGELIQDDSFYSNYQPWQAVYLVGTGE